MSNLNKRNTVIRKRGGYRVYIGAQDIPLLEDILTNDVYYQQSDCTKEEKNRVIAKLLDRDKQNSHNHKPT